MSSESLAPPFPDTEAVGPPAIAVHGGAASPEAERDGCEAAARAAHAMLLAGAAALEAAVFAVVLLENDGRYNAGAGARLRLDGRTVETDAAVMDSAGRLGAVAALRGIRNPVEVARAVAATPHWMLAGEGARAFALRLGMPEAELPGELVERAWRRTIHALEAPAAAPGVDDAPDAWRRFWNYPTSWATAMQRLGHGTVGAVARDRAGGFAVATSTGGCAPSLLGRVGDTPIVGSGFWAGAAGAVAATGQGEAIVRRQLARAVYDRISAGVPVANALQAGLALFGPDDEIGLIGIGPGEAAVRCSRSMAAAIQGNESEHRLR